MTPLSVGMGMGAESTVKGGDEACRFKKRGWASPNDKQCSYINVGGSLACVREWNYR